ncbi:unnamed protein product [Heligmosomoides polygyrus]|uniref:PITH domain-containing protein n=1 Tax=Heligmosomoides polygyrus TaxID=6339 RepID=A0A183GAX6_HELPZ|nr:unnamed protein product [Heligmosomoides polygyrus]
MTAVRGSSMPLTLMELDSVTSLDHAKLAPLARVHLIFASEHHVIGIKQRPGDGLPKILCYGIHDDNKEEWRNRRTLVNPTEMGNSIEIPAAASTLLSGQE